MGWIDNLIVYLVFKLTGETVERVYGSQIVAYSLLIVVLIVFALQALLPDSTIIEKKSHVIALSSAATLAVLILIFA